MVRWYHHMMSKGANDDQSRSAHILRIRQESTSMEYCSSFPFRSNMLRRPWLLALPHCITTSKFNPFHDQSCCDSRRDDHFTAMADESAPPHSRQQHLSTSYSGSQRIRTKEKQHTVTDQEKVVGLAMHEATLCPNPSPNPNPP